jgi:hemerythrin superfamily protein
MKRQRSLRTDIVALLLADHEQIQRRMEAFRFAREEADQASLRDLVSLLVAHETAEELIVYPVVRRQSAGGDAIAEDRLREQTEATHLLRDIEKTPFGEADFWYLVDELSAAVLRHAQAEEQSFFRALSASLEPAESQKMADQYQRAMQASPTHPHPLSPHSRPLEAVVVPAVAVLDRARDRLSGRHQDSPDVDSGSLEEREIDDVFSLLTADHQVLNSLATQLQIQAETAPRSTLDQFSARLATHTAVELEVIYPAVQHSASTGEDLNVVKQGRLDHEEIAMSLVRLQKVPLNTAEFRKELSHLISETRLHIERDRETVFPRLRALTPESLQELAHKGREVRRHAPVRPHPRVLKSGPGSKLANRLLSLTDRARRGTSQAS